VNFKQNYFELFGLPASWVRDAQALDRLAETYRRLQQQIHPDRFVDSTDHEKRLSLQYSVFINEAYETLVNPVRQAAYLLEMNGRPLRTDESLGGELNGGFLMQQMELRESLEEIESGSESDLQKIERLEQLKADVRQDFNAVLDEFGSAIESGSLDTAQALAYQMQYTEKLLEEIDRVEEKLMDY